MPLFFPTYRCQSCKRTAPFHALRGISFACTCAKRNKLKSRKVICNGLKFDSTMEAEYYSKLKWLESKGLISELELQPIFKCDVAEKHVCDYFADFKYCDDKGVRHVKDVKGKRQDIFNLKKKLVEALYPVVVELVRP